MLYLDETLPDHFKIHEAGKLIGGKDGRLIALGLFVTAIAYARHQVTDGFVPSTVVEHYPRRTGGIKPSDALVQVGLLDKSESGRYTIHDYHDWNPSAETIKEAKLKARLRKAKWRADRKNGSPVDVPPVSQGDNSVPHASHARTRDVPGTGMIPHSPSPIQKEQEQENSGFAASPPAQPNTSAALNRLSREPSDDRNYRVILRLSHDVMEKTGMENPTDPDLLEAIKGECSRRRIDYSAPGVLTRAVECAARQRLTPAPIGGGTGREPAPVGNIAASLRGASPEEMGARIQQLARTKRRG